MNKIHQYTLLVVTIISSLAVLLFNELLFQRPLTGLSHMMLFFMMWGLAGGYVIGVGFKPINTLARIIFYPLLIWILLIISWLVLLI